MTRSTLSQISLALASAVVVTSLQSAPGAARPVMPTQSQGINLALPLPDVEPLRESSTNTFLAPVGDIIPNGDGCPAGTQLVLFDQPIYDEEELFVVGYESVPYCIDENFEPEG